MTLSYRGHNYTPSPVTVKAETVAHTGIYRGLKTQWTQQQATVAHSGQRVYRGVHQG
jgi:hypothetical protein